MTNHKLKFKDKGIYPSVSNLKSSNIIGPINAFLIDHASSPVGEERESRKWRTGGGGWGRRSPVGGEKESGNWRRRGRGRRSPVVEEKKSGLGGGGVR